ncbi:MAG: Trm112 family protein [Gammaproteobacteria bacterium]|nr:MAG: Trm112 family protein [Gammaproteobacteria bacterium]
MSINQKLLDMLCCPATKIPVVKLEKEALSDLNSKIESGEVFYNDGVKVEAQIKEALITKNNELIYVVEDGIPIMITEKSIAADFIDQNLL